jgi:quinol monooxygenase YgiN
MNSAPGKREILRMALETLAGELSGSEGLLSVTVLTNSEEENEFVFVEKWVSVQAHVNNPKAAPEHALASVKAALAGRPRGGYFEYVLET